MRINKVKFTSAHSETPTVARQIGGGWLVFEKLFYAISAAAFTWAIFEVTFSFGTISLFWNALSLVSLAITAFGAAVAVTIYRRQSAKAQADSESQISILSAINSVAAEAALKATEAAENSLSAVERTKLVQALLEKAEKNRKLPQPSLGNGLQSLPVEIPILEEPRHILWVDDNRPYIDLERRAFEASGLVVTWVSSTKRALEILEGNHFDLVISDMGRLEGPREGYALLDRMRGSENQTPFLIYSTSDSLEHWNETLEHGGQGCTSSPSVLYALARRELRLSEPRMA